MKNQALVKLGKVLVLIPCLLFLVNCSKSSKDSNNNQCYQQQPSNQGYNQGYNQQPYNQGSTYYNPNCNNSQYGQGTSCVGTYWIIDPQTREPFPILCSTPYACQGLSQMYQVFTNAGGQNNQPTAPGQPVQCL